MSPLLKNGKKAAELCPCSSTQWKAGKAELKSDGLQYVAKKISKQCVEGAPWLFLIAYSEM